MGYAVVIGSCCACHKIIGFNPHAVPSLLVNGKREPLCKTCAIRWNELHPDIAKPIQPNAYKPIREEEL
jgi:hypothetical protein